MPEVKCPKCGAARLYYHHNKLPSPRFECSTRETYADDNSVSGLVQSEECHIRQLESTVARLRKALEEIVVLDDYRQDEAGMVARAALEETK